MITWEAKNSFFLRKIIRVLKKHVFCLPSCQFSIFFNFVFRFVISESRRFFKGINIKIWWFSFFDFTRVGFENIWKSKIYHPFSWIVIHNLGTWKFYTVFSMGIQKNKTWVKCLAQKFWKSAYPNIHASIING